MTTPDGIPSGSALRILAALQLLARGSHSVVASYSEIGAAAQRSRSIVAAGIGELIMRGWIEQRKAFGGRAAYTFTTATTSQVAPVADVAAGSSVVQKFSSSVVHPARTTEADFHSAIRSGTGTGTGGGGARELLKSPEPAEPEPAAPPTASESPARQRARALLREFNVGEPTQTDLAAALESRFAQDDGAPATVRRICERTREDWHRGWARNPIGLTVSRIRRFVAGEQLSFLAELGQPDAVKRAASGGRRGSGRATRRPQVSYTAEQREAKAAEARDRARASGGAAEALRAQLARAEASAVRAQDAERRKYWTDYVARLRARLGEVAI
jgi:hypothetical protein